MLNGSHSNSFEVYNPINDKWKFLSPPTVSRTRHTMVATETHIYVIGGEGQGIEPEISMERYDPVVNLWSFVLPMNCGKVGACAVELEGKIYVMGGNNGYNTLRQCEIYDVETHQWNLAKGKIDRDNVLFWPIRRNLLFHWPVNRMQHRLKSNMDHNVNSSTTSSFSRMAYKIG